MGTPAFEDETGEEGDYVVTVHTSAQVKEIAEALRGVDASKAANSQEVAGFFMMAAEADQGLAIFLH